MAKKPSLGRQKIEITKIKKKNHLQVTFSKRKAGLFKKASELCTLCGAEIAILVFSPAGKVFSFGHPSVESIVNKFSARNQLLDSGDDCRVDTHQSAGLRELTLQLTQVQYQVEQEKSQGEILSQIRKTSQRQCWWGKPVQELALDEVEQLGAAMEALRKSVDAQFDKLLTEPANNNAPFFMNGTIGNVDLHRIERKPDFTLNNNVAIACAIPPGFDFGLFY